MALSGWVTFIGTVAATILAYNFSAYMAEKVFFSLIPEEMEEYIKYLPRILKKGAKKIMPLPSIVEMIVVFASNLFFLWIFNTIVLQFVIYAECQKIIFKPLEFPKGFGIGFTLGIVAGLFIGLFIGLQSGLILGLKLGGMLGTALGIGGAAHIAATNALGGAIAASVALLAWNILQLIPILSLLAVIEGFPLIGWLIIPFILIIFNLIFGAGVGKAVALHQACSSEPEQATELFHPFPTLDNYDQTGSTQSTQSTQSTIPSKTLNCGINNIIGCLRSEKIIERFDKSKTQRNQCNLKKQTAELCQNKPFGVCDKFKKDTIIPLRSNYHKNTSTIMPFASRF